MRRISLTIFVALLVACAHGNRPESDERDRSTRLVILHTNDTHGHVWGSDKVGSSARRASLVSSIRSEIGEDDGVVLLLDAGDVRTGTLCSDRNHALPDLETMDAMGYDAMVVGNHEFDQSIDVTLEQRTKVRFPILGANVENSESGEPMLDRYTFIERGGLKIAIFGLVTTASVSTSTRGADPRLRFLSATATANELVPELRRQADVVIALTHLGQDEDRALALAVDGIDIIVGGHSHDELHTPLVVGDTVIVQAGSDGRFLGRVDFEATRGGVRLREGSLVPITLDLPEDPRVAEILGRYACEDAGETIIVLAEPLTSDPLDGPGTSSILSNLISDAYRSIAESDLALMNQGGIRAELDSGPITAADIHEVLPFDNTVVIVRVTGGELVEIARSIRARGREGRGIVYTSGMTFVFGPGDDVQVLFEGQPIDVERSYTMAMSSFLAGGGDGHTPLAGLMQIRQLEGTTSSVFVEYLRRVEQLAVDRQSRTRWMESSEPAPPSPKSDHPARRRPISERVLPVEY